MRQHLEHLILDILKLTIKKYNTQHHLLIIYVSLSKEVQSIYNNLNEELNKEVSSIYLSYLFYLNCDSNNSKFNETSYQGEYVCHTGVK